MLDVDTLRVLLAVVTLCVLLLFYLGVYRPTHSPFSGWWTLALVCAASSSSLLLLNGTVVQVIANPLSTLLSAAGAMCVWFATRSLRSRPSPVWLLAVVPVGCFAVALFDSPSTNTWAGNGVLFGVMAGGFGAGAFEVWGTYSQRREERDGAEGSEAVMAVLVSAIAGTILAVLYVARFIAYMIVGPLDGFFTNYLGTAVTSLTLMLCLVAVTFSISAIGWDQRTRELRRRALEDDLTGLLGRAAFFARVQKSLNEAGGRRNRRSWLVIADLDDFKPVNDAFGHAAGDRTLQRFATVAKGALRSSDAIGRLGGDEFGIVFEGVELSVVVARLDVIRARLAQTENGTGRPMPTVSFGVAECSNDLTVGALFGRADAALYRAKRSGRNQTAVYDEAEASK